VYWNIIYPFAFGSAPLDITSSLAYAGTIGAKILKGDMLFWILGFYAAILFAKNRMRQGLFLACIGIGLAAGVSAGFRFREHYFILLMPCVALMSGWGMLNVWEQRRTIKHTGLRIIMATAYIVLIAGIPLRANAAYLFNDTPREISRKLYGANPFVEAPVIAAYIREHTTETDTIFIIGSEPEIYFYAQRKNPTNQLFFYPLTASYGPASTYQRETVSAVQAAKPCYIIVVDIPTSLYASEPVNDRYVFDELNRMISADYQMDGYVLIGRHESWYQWGARAVAPEFAGQRIPIFLYKRKTL
jgi:hypothetical protein